MTPWIGLPAHQRQAHFEAEIRKRQAEREGLRCATGQPPLVLDTVFDFGLVLDPETARRFYLTRYAEAGYEHSAATGGVRDGWVKFYEDDIRPPDGRVNPGVQASTRGKFTDAVTVVREGLPRIGMQDLNAGGTPRGRV